MFGGKDIIVCFLSLSFFCVLFFSQLFPQLFPYRCLYSLPLICFLPFLWYGCQQEHNFYLCSLAFSTSLSLAPYLSCSLVFYLSLSLALSLSLPLPPICFFSLLRWFSLSLSLPCLFLFSMKGVKLASHSPSRI